MFSLENVAVLQCLGWLTVLTFAALAPSLPGMPGRPHAGWLLAFCAMRLLAGVQAFVLAGSDAPLRRFAAVVVGMLLWEFARRIRNDSADRRLSAVTHVAGLEAMALAQVGGMAEDGDTPGWLLPIEVLLTSLPVLLGGGALLLIWRRLERPSLRLAVMGLGLSGVEATGPVTTAVATIAPWLAAIGCGIFCFSHGTARTRPALGCVAGLLLTIAVGPPIMDLRIRDVDAHAQDELLRRVQQAAAPLQGSIAARLVRANEAPSPISAETKRGLHEHLQRLRVADSLLREARIWRPIGDRRSLLASTSEGPGGFDLSPTTADERRIAAGSRPIVIPARHDDAIASSHAPLFPARFETASAWLTLEYPAAFWAVQREHARRTSAMFLGFCAAFCGMGFVLAGRHSLEARQQLAVERAQSADKAKSEFLAFLSHEMRTPLQTIIGRADLVRRKNAASARDADAIETQGKHLLRLVNDLLDFGTIEAGKMKLQPAPFELRTLLATLEEIHGPAAAAKGLTLDVVVAGDVPANLVGDDVRVRQILGNLLGNAVKYTQRGTITLKVTRAAPAPGPSLPPLGDSHLCHLLFTVADTGPGLPPDKIPALFTLFTRLDEGGTFTREGTGIGLALVRRLSELMAGTVTAANRPQGGAEFTVGLPLARNPAPVRTANAASLANGSLRVLVAEDNDAAREFLTEAIIALGHHVESVADGNAALRACHHSGFDAVVLDINLPGRDGVAIARELCARMPKPRLVGCSAEVSAVSRDAALAAGMDILLEKPVTIAELAAALAPANSTSLSGSLFERLRSPVLAAEVRATLRRDLPRQLERMHAAHRDRDASSLRQQAHQLRSTALLADDGTLAELCRRLDQAAELATDRKLPLSCSR